MSTTTIRVPRPEPTRLSFRPREQFSAAASTKPPPQNAAPTDEDGSADEMQAFVDLKVRLHQKMLEIINLSAIENLAPHEVHAEIGGLVGEILLKEQVPLSKPDQQKLADEVVDELIGLGPLEPLLKDPTVNDILVNTHASVFVERRGKLEPTKVRFKDDQHLLRIIEKIVSKVGRRIDETQPMVDARLPDGSRVNAVIPPIALDGPLLSIRKFAKIPFDIGKLVENGAITPEISELLQGIVRSRLNIVISGGTGTGKTTFLNAISNFISARERIVTIEDAAELQLQQPHVARLETRPPNVEGRGRIEQRELLKNALRMRPDRIIVGEVRGGEAFDMLQAMNTGHDGSITTVHANTARDAVSRLEQMVSMSGLELPTRAIRAQIASALDVIIQLQRFGDGTRRLVSLCEIVGMEGEVVTMQEIFRFEQHGVDADETVRGEIVATGIRASFADRLIRNGIDLSPDLFKAKIKESR